MAGQPVRTYGGIDEAFTHAIILGFSEDGRYAKVARPYAYASNVGTTGPSVLLGCETYEARVDCLKAFPQSLHPRVVSP